MIPGRLCRDGRVEMPLNAYVEIIGASSWSGRAHRGNRVSMTGLPIDEWLYDHPGTHNMREGNDRAVARGGQSLNPMGLRLASPSCPSRRRWRFHGHRDEGATLWRGMSACQYLSPGTMDAKFFGFV